MATRHELIHIDFVANAGKANPVMKSLQVACDDARVAKEKLDKELANAKAAGAPAKVIADIEGRLKAQTKTWEALQKGMREYTKGIDTLSKGIKEFNQGTLDQMSAKFNKSVYNAAKLVQSTVETGSKYWNQLQRLMDATDRNVTRAKEDIVTMMQSLKDGSSVSTVQLTRAKEVLEDLSRLAVYNSEEWRNLKAQMNEVAQAVDMVAATERSLKGEIASEQDALRLSNALTQESINLRHADGEAAMQAAKKEREGIEATMKGLSDKKAQRSKELDDIRDEIELQEHLDEVIKKRDQKIADARSTKQDAEQKRDEADRTIKAYDDQKAKVGELKKQVDELTKEQGKEAKAAEKAAEKAEKHAEAVGKQQEKVSGLEKEVEKLEQDLDTLSKQPVKPTVDTSGVDDAKKKINQEPIKPKVDDSEVKALEARLKAIQDAIAEKRQQIEAESKKGAGSISQWEETLKRVQGSKDGRLTAMGLGDEKKQMDDLLDVANRFYEIIKKVKGVTEDKFIPAQAAEPIKQLAEYYQITEEEARKLIQTLERSDVVQKKFATMRFDEHTGFLAVEQKKGVDDQQIRIEAAQSYLEKAREREAGQTERINKLTGELNDLEKKEAEQKEKIAAASEKAAQAAEQQNEATDKKVKLSKKEQQEVEKLTQDNAALTSTIEALKKQRDALTASDEKGAEAAKKGAEAAKEEAQAMKMTAEEAKAALEEMRKMSTLKLKGDTGLEASNIEQAQQYLMGRIKAINPSGVGGGRFTLQGKNQIKDLIDAFKKDYGIGSDKEAREIVSRLVTGKNGGLIQRGVYDKEFGALQVTVDPEALKQRGARMLELTNISKGVTAATKEQTAADQAQEEEVKRLREAYRQEDETLRKRKEEYQKRLDKANAIGGPEEKDGKRTARGQALDDAETYRQRYVVKQEERTKAAWEEYQAVKSGTQATEANTKAKKDNVSVDQQKKQIDEQIAALEQQKAGNTERLTQLQEKGAKAAKKNAEATQEQTQAVKESADAEMTMEQLLKRREDLDSKLAAKKEQLRKAQEELEKMTKSETAAEKEQSDVTARLTQKQAEYNEELQKMGPMKEARDQATKDRRNAQRVINRSDDTINTTMREVLPERKSEEEMTQMRKKAEDLQKEINDLTQAFDQNAQAITNLNRKETEAAIEMAQSENVSIEKVKQAIELLKKKIETEATDAKTMQERGDAINRLSERLTQMNAEVAKLSQPIADRLKVDDLGMLSETEIRQGIEAAKQLIQTYKSGSDEANQLAERIVKAEKHLKDTGIEAARTAQKQAEAQQLLAEKHKQMQDRMSALNRLSKEGLTETQRYWQAQMDGATRGSRAFKEAERNLKRINAEQEKQTQAQLEASANRLGRKNLRTLSGAELQESVNAAKQLLATMKPTNAAYTDLQNNIIRAEEHMKQYGLETARNAQQAAAQLQMMKDRMVDLSKLSDAGLEETRRYWQAQMDGAERTSQAYIEAKANMEAIVHEQQKLAAEQVKTDAQKIYGNKMLMSEGSIRNAIEAAKQYQQTLAATSPEYQRLKTAIVDAEEHIKKYGVEAERTARKEAQAIADAARKRQENDTMMRKQLYNTRDLSASALKAQEQYWQRLIDDPNTAAASLARYEKDLKRVRQLQEQAIKTEGQEAFNFFKDGKDENASANEIKKQADALKKYRDSLPQKDNADTIAKINEYLIKAGQSAEKAAQQAMSLRQAVTIGKQVRGGSFSGSTEELKQAKKVLEELQQRVEKGGRSWQKLQRDIDGINIELKRVNTISKEVQEVLDRPKGRSYNELKQAVEQGRLKLQSMDRTTKEGQKAFDELAKKIKACDLEMKTLGNSAKGTVSAFDKAWGRLKTYISLYVGAAVAMQKITSTMGDLMTLSDKMGEVRKTTHFTADEVGRLSDNLTKLDTRTPIEQLLSISARGGQLGLKAQEDIRGFTEAANQLMVALPEMGEESATELMKIAKATGDLKRNGDDVQETLERVGSTIIELRANSASTAPAITDFVKRVGAVGAQAGITIDQVAALGSTVDALGGRVEMSATALSRMIPAIRNNSFAVANAIGVTEKSLKDLFNSGRAMDAMVLIFQKMRESVQQYDTSTEKGLNAMADHVEEMLGKNATMQEVMKELNQQGARAGIVFGLLSQNVDELEKQLGIANNAYRQNTALLNEYNNMNETTAAKWERLKNSIEEWFVSDSAQRFLGRIIDGLRTLADWFASDGPLAVGFKLMLTYAAAMKLQIGAAFMGIGGGFKTLTTALMAGMAGIGTSLGVLGEKLGLVTARTRLARMEWKKMDLAMKQNVIGAIIAAIAMLAMKMWEWHKAAKEAAAEVGRFNQKMADEKKALDSLFEPLNKSNLAQKDRLDLIKQINDKYGKYLGYMLSETSSAIQLADAHALIAKRIREEAYERRIAEKEKKIQEEYDEDLSADYGKIVSRVRSGAKSGTDVERIADSLKSLVDQNIEKIDKRWGGGIVLAPEFNNKLNGFLERLVADGELSKKSVSGVRSALISYMNDAKDQHNDIMSQTANLRSDLRGIQGAIKYDLANNINTLVSKVASTVGNAVRNIKQQQQNTPLMLQPQGGGSGVNIPNLFGGQQQGGWSAPWQQTRETTPDQQMAPAGWKPDIDKKNVEQVRQFVADQDALRGALQASGEQLDEAQRKVAESWLLSDEQLKEYRKIIQKADYSPGGKNANPYGDYNKVTSPYSEWNGDDLVARRKEMLERVKALANGADVQAVLSEDAKFISDAVRKNIKTTNDAIEWYNSERLKIQDALHAKHLTNTGDWLDPKAQRRASRVVRDEMKYYLDELDAYYTERKAKIQEAQNDEEISEAEARNRTIANEAEWRQRRAELQQLYAKKGAKVTQAEQQAIFNIISERTGETTTFIQRDIAQTVKFIEDVGKKSKAAMDRIYGNLDKDIEQDFLRQRNAIGQHMKAIQDIIDKERPFNGITKDLQTNLTTMGILTAHMSKERDELMAKNADMTKFNEKQAQEAFKEMTFLLGEAENAYSTTAEEVMQRAAEAGLTAWVEEMKQNPQMQEGLMAQLRSTFDTIQDAIKKEASQLKKEAEIMWNNILMPDGETTMKQAFDKTISTLGIEQGRVSRANSLIGAGQASERVVDKLAIKQMQVQMATQKAYYDLMRKRGLAQVEILKQQSKELEEQGKLEEAKRKSQDAQHVQMALNLATTKEQTELLKLEEELTAKVEESQNRLYTELKEWGNLLSSSLQSIFEASNAGNADYYNERAKMDLTGKGGPGAGTYVVIDNAGTSDAQAHYEYLDERQALEREHEIEQQNAQAEAWSKVMDDINMKMSESITDWMNAFLQSQSVDLNTAALGANTAAINALTSAMGGVPAAEGSGDMGTGEDGVPNSIRRPEENNGGEAPTYKAPWQMTDEDIVKGQENMGLMWQSYTEQGTEAMMQMQENLAETPGITPPWQMTEESMQAGMENMQNAYQGMVDASNKATGQVLANQSKIQQGENQTDKKISSGAQSAFAKMTAAANLYGIAYQAMSNDNLSTAQKFEMIAVQAAGQAAISALTASLAQNTGQVAADTPAVASKAFAQLGPIGGAAAFAAITAILGGLVGLAVSKIAKSKSQIAQVTGASVGAGRMATGMLTYGEGNVNEFTDPSTLTPGRQYNVDSADGKTYRARYMGKNAKTHITNGPEFHLVGEKGREAIIDAHTTRQLQMDDNGIWQSIQTLYNGGRLSHSSMRRRGRGVRAFADGNLDEFEEVESTLGGGDTGISMEQVISLKESIDRQSDLLEDLRTNGIKATFDVYGKGGLVDSYDTGKKNVTRHGERY